MAFKAETIEIMTEKFKQWSDETIAELTVVAIVKTVRTPEEMKILVLSTLQAYKAARK